MVENISLAFQGIWGHKMRSVLTMLGIIIGIAAIITIVSTIRGTNEQIKENLIGAGNNVVTVQLCQDGYPADLDWSELPRGVGVIDEESRGTLEDIDGAERASLYLRRQWAENVYYGSAAYTGQVLGIDQHYLDTCGYAVSHGRGLVEKDHLLCRKVALVDEKTAAGLFSGEDPVGKTLELYGEPFTVVGVVHQRKSSEPVINSLEDYWMYADTSSGSVMIPMSCWPIVYRYDEPPTVAVRCESTDHMTAAGAAVAEAINAQFITGETYLYQSDNLLEQAANLQSLSETTNRQLIWIAGISLLVGGIGVMNIMLVSVTERTREIGLKIAIGARQSRILWQFLTEAAVLTSLGGMLGVGCGIALAFLLSSVMGAPVAISPPACLIAVAFSMLIGVVFGLMPAVKASKLNPIEALRRE